ncbi:V-type proton ATPase subunit e 1-like [Tubulanus polymorphus]|uniref:V-type proton ATPase subunit e 1-like n=1 Tax=Tubulanus polymorphus TaxID=672921 RepID=UPI003DA2AB6E
MGAVIAILVMTALFVVVGIILPFVVPKGPNRGIIQTMLSMTAVCVYLFWLCTILMQLNPLIGPQLDGKNMYILQKLWTSN